MVKVGGQGQGICHEVKSGEGSRFGVQVWGQGLGRGHGLGVKVVVKVGVKVRGQGRGIKVRVMIGGHKGGGQGRWSRSGYRSWGQVGGGVMVGFQVRGQGLGAKVGGQGQGSRSWGQCQGHDRWSQGRGSMSGVKVRGVVKVRGRGSRFGRLGSDGRLGRLEITSLILSRTHDRIEFHSIPFHSIPIQSNPFHSIPFHSNPFHSMFYPMPFYSCNVLQQPQYELARRYLTIIWNGLRQRKRDGFAPTIICCKKTKCAYLYLYITFIKAGESSK